MTARLLACLGVRCIVGLDPTGLGPTGLDPAGLDHERPVAVRGAPVRPAVRIRTALALPELRFRTKQEQLDFLGNLLLAEDVTPQA
jgi:hypothetical protein